MSTTIVSNIGNLPNATGMGQQTHIIYAVNSARWWLFHMASTTSIQSWYSSDGATWTQGATLTLTNASTGDGRDLSVAYANIASTDVIHLTYSNGGSTWQQYHVRGTISGTTLTWGSVAAVGFGAGTNGQTEPTGLTVAFDSNNKLWQATSAFADFFAVQSTNADTGSAWTSGWPGSDTQVIGNNIINWTHTRVLIAFAASGKVIGISGNASSGTSDNAYWSNLFNGSAWGGETNIGFSDTNAQGPNEWTACRQDDTHFHMVKATGTSNTTYEHRIFNGSSWGAGNSIPTLATKADSGFAMASDGTSVWLFAIAGDAANTVKYIQWTAGTWGSWTNLETSSQTRNDISVCPTQGGGAWQVIWTETVTAGSQYNIVGAQLTTSTGPTTITLTESGTGGESVSATGTISLPTDGATGTESIVIGLPFSESRTGSEAIDFTSITATLTDSDNGSDALTATISPPQTDSANGSDSITQVTVTLPLSDTANGLDAISVQVSSVPLADTGNGTENATAAVTLTLTDPSNGTELTSIQATMTLPTDTATGTDGVSVNTGAGAITLTDLATGTETLALGPITPALPDARTGTDVIQITMPLALTENGSGSDVLTSQVTAAITTDTGTGSDGVSVSASVPRTDSGTGSENIVLGTLSIPLSELGASSEAMTVVVSPNVTNAATASDAITLATVGVSLLDSGTGVQLFSATVVFSLPLEAASGTDAINVASVQVNIVTLDESGIGVESVMYTPVEFASAILYTLDGVGRLCALDAKATLYRLDATDTIDTSTN